MVDSLVEAAVRARALVLGIAVLFAALGYAAYRETPIEAFPDVTNLQVNVVTTAPGLAPPEVERQITLPLERSFHGLPGLVGMRSESLFGLSLVYLTFDDGADSFRSRALVEARLSHAELPLGANPRLGADATPLGEIFHFRLRSSAHSPAQLRSELEWVVAPRLRGVPGVADVVGRGGYLEEIHVEVEPARLEAHDLVLDDVRDALDRASRNVGGGVLTHGEQQLVIRSVGAFADPHAIADVLVKADEGVPVTIGDVGRVLRSHVPRQGSAAHGSDPTTVEGIVLMRRGENPSRVLDGIHDAVRELGRGELPSGVRIETFRDRSTLVDRTLSTVHTNLLEGATFCVALVWLFLRSFRGAVVVAITIPLALLTAFVGLRAVGLPANLISMGAIDFGILVDGAVILVESIQHRLVRAPPETPQDRLRSIASAAREVARPTFFAMSIILAALLPVFALERVEGRIFRPLALTYSFALVGALVGALAVVPALSAYVLRPPRTTDAEEEPRLQRLLRRLHERLLGALIERPARLAGAMLLLGSATCLVGATLGSEFLPELDEGDFTIFVELPSTTSLEVTEGLLTELRARLERHPEVREVATRIGRPEDGTDNESVNMALNFVRLRPKEEWSRGTTKEDLVRRMRADLEHVPGIRFGFSQPMRDSVEESISGVRGKAVLKVFGDDLERMRSYLQDALRVVRTVPGVVEASLYRDRSVPQLEIRPDREALARSGISMEDFQGFVETALGGTVENVLHAGERVVPIRLRFPLPEREDPTHIGDLWIVTPAGARVPLRTLAEISVVPGRASINRERNRRSLALKFNVEGRDSGSVVRDAIAAVRSRVPTPEGCRIEWGGEFENQARAMKRLGVVVPLALVAVFVLLTLALRSLSGATTILLLAPFGLSGGVFALRILGIPLSVSAAVGFIALLGQSSLGGLLVAEAIDEKRAEGLDSTRAVLEGTGQRLRAVVLTTLLAMLGLLPMATSTAIGAETQRPFAVVVVGGMVTTFLVAVFAVPVIQGIWLARAGSRPTGGSDEQG